MTQSIKKFCQFYGYEYDSRSPGGLLKFMITEQNITRNTDIWDSEDLQGL